MKVSFLVSSQSVLKRLSRNFATIIIWLFGNNPENFAKFHLVFQKLDHLTGNAILRINRVSARGGSGPPHSAPQGGISPPCWQKKLKYFSYFTVISVKIDHFKHQNLKTLIFSPGGVPADPRPF